MPHLPDSDRTPPELKPLYLAPDALPANSVWGAEMRLDAARAALAVAHRAQPADRHFRGLPESPEVIAAYDAVRAAEREVARLEREGRRP